MFAATTPENTPMAYHASTLANPNPVISLAFVEANYEALESLLRDRCRLKPTRAATPPLRVASPKIHRRGERTVGFEGAQSGGESRVERNTEWGRPLEEAPRGNGGQSVNLPPLLAAHLGRGENRQPLQSSLTSAYRGQALQNNIGRNLPSSVTQQKKFTKTHLAVHNIKQREGESTRAFITRYRDDTLQILGLHEEQRISGFVHGLRTRSLVEHLSTDLPSTYKGLMEKTYTWVKAREVATNGASGDRGDNFERNKKEEQSHLNTPTRKRKKKKDKVTAPAKAPIHMSQIGRNLEAYVDDMVIKSTFEKEILKDIQETFERFRSINMKLNPKKCPFGVEEGSFLGHLITKQGIKANPSKVKAVTDLDQPRTLKDIQSFNGKLAALSRFLSKGAERSLAFFKVLKGWKEKRTYSGQPKLTKH
ncbi:hypothetical protein Tco_0915634 [Tanacetum coccineum]